MNKKSLLGFFFGSVLALCGDSIQAAIIADWTFETSVPTTPGPIAPEVGSGTGTGVHAGAATYSSPSGNGSAQSWNSNTWAIGDYYQFQASTLGESGITISWDQTRSSSGPGQPNPSAPSFKLQYSTDGTNFTDAFSYIVPVTGNTGAVWTSQFADLSSVSALDNQSAVYFRMTAIQAAQSANGQSRVDNVVIASVPEPTAGLLLVSAVLLVAGRRNRRHYS